MPITVGTASELGETAGAEGRDLETVFLKIFTEIDG
jgi:hypothetical protein